MLDNSKDGNGAVFHYEVLVLILQTRELSTIYKAHFKAVRFIANEEHRFVSIAGPYDVARSPSPQHPTFVATLRR